MIYNLLDMVSANTQIYEYLWIKHHKIVIFFESLLSICILIFYSYIWIAYFKLLAADNIQRHLILAFFNI